MVILQLKKKKKKMQNANLMEQPPLQGRYALQVALDTLRFLGPDPLKELLGLRPDFRTAVVCQLLGHSIIWVKFDDYDLARQGMLQRDLFMLARIFEEMSGIEAGGHTTYSLNAGTIVSGRIFTDQHLSSDFDMEAVMSI